MKFIFIIISLLLLSTIIRADFDIEIDENTHSNYQEAVITHADLELYVDFTKETLEGTVTHTFKALQQVSEILLDSWDLSIGVVDVIQNGQTTKPEIKILPPTTPEGETLKIELVSPIEKDEEFQVKINYVTLGGTRLGLTFLKAEDTVDQVLPFFYTQFEPIYARGFMPTQDTPAVKFTWACQVTVPQQEFSVFMSGDVLQSKVKQPNGDYTHKFLQGEKVPGYLISLVIGNLQREEVKESNVDNEFRTYVIAEPSQIEEVTEKLSMLDLYVEATQSIMGDKYPWDSFSIVIMPPNYPLEGMEHPQLSYAAPSILKSGKTGTSIVLNTIAHSWFGNLVTCVNWRNFWLNQGFSLYLEREAQAVFFSTSYRDIDRVVGNITMIAEINLYTDSDSFTSLHPQTKGINPVDIFNMIQSEKGYQFLEYLKNLVSEITLHNILAEYVTQYQNQSVQWEQFRDFFIEQIETKYSSKSDVLDQIDWESWILQDGHIPENTLQTFESTEYTEATQLAYTFWQFQGSSIPNNYKDLENWNQDMKYAFIDYFLHSDRILQTTRRLCEQLDKLYNFTESEDYNLLYRWFTLSTYNGYDRFITQEIQEFLGNTGRIKFLGPIYKAWDYTNRFNKAKSVFYKNFDFYHPIAQQEIAEILGLEDLPTNPNPIKFEQLKTNEKQNRNMNEL